MFSGSFPDEQVVARVFLDVQVFLGVVNSQVFDIKNYLKYLGEIELLPTFLLFFATLDFVTSAKSRL